MSKKGNYSGIKNLGGNVGNSGNNPCRDCRLKKELPDCLCDCKIVNELRATLNDVIACSDNYPELEPYSLPY